MLQVKRVISQTIQQQIFHEGNNLYFTETRSRESISTTQPSGDGSIVYDNSNGVLTYTGPSAAETKWPISQGALV